MSDLARVRASLAGRYIVERELGRGGMARVYLARDLKHGRYVALKVLNSAISDSAGTERFLREIRTTARLTHPAILPLHDSGEVNGVPFYTMPWVDGESLRDLLEREGALPVARAVEIAACIAEALSYAHDAGVIHRDIKPDNILIARTGHIWVSDFGLAHALAGAASARLSSGVALGSPHYMSPEQALGQESNAGSTDVYSLGCLLYEMLSGAPPFDGPVASVLSRQITEIAPDIRAGRADIPDYVASLVDAALAKNPAQRPGARHFEAILKGDEPPGVSAPAWRRARTRRISPMQIAVAAGIIIAVTGALLVVAGWDTFATMIGRGPMPDSTSYAVLTLTGDDDAAAEHVTHLLNEAIGRWDGISLVDPFRVSDLEAQRGSIDLEDLGDVSRDLGASRFVRGEVRRDREWILVHASVYDAGRRNRSLANATVRIPADLSGAEGIIDALADSLLFHGAPPPSFGAGVRGTHSAPALRTYLDAHAAMRDWEPRRADSLFTAALQLDPSYTRARLWQAQLRNWTDRERAQWSTLASQAADDTAALNPKERVLATALSALGRRDYVQACALYGDLSRTDPNDFMASYGLGECLRRDSRVVPDRGSATGWSFRSSAHGSVEAYRRAFALLPASHKAFRGSAYEAVRGKFYTSVSTLRSGNDESGAQYVAVPQWTGDTLAFVPEPLNDAGSAVTAFSSPATLTAVRKMRGIFHDVARGWVAAYPNSPAALEAQAVALEMIGADSALAVLRSARRAVTNDPDYALHLLVSELWLRTKRALPADTAELRVIVRTADSLLANTDDVSQMRAERLASLAAVTGRANLAATLARRGAVAERIRLLELSTNITGPGGALKAFAALNGPVDSIRVLEAQVERAISNTFEPASRDEVRAQWTARAATLAFPVYRSPLVTSPLAEMDYVLAAQQAFMNGKLSAMQSILDETTANRAAAPPAGWTVDGVYPEAWLIAQANGTRAAGPYLCPLLNAISLFEPGSLNDVPAAGSLPLAMLLYARALRAQGASADADRWYAAVSILWSHADPHLQRALRAPDPPPMATAVAAPVRRQASPTSSCFPGG